MEELPLRDDFLVRKLAPDERKKPLTVRCLDKNGYRNLRV